MKTCSTPAIPGDGIGAEVITAGVDVIQALAEEDGSFQMAVETFPWGADYYMEHGQMTPEEGLDTLKPFNAIYFGSAGDHRIPDHITLCQLRLNICQVFGQYANVRPTRVLPGVHSLLAGIGPGNFDWVIVGENFEGEYAKIGGRVHQDFDKEVGMDVSVFTRTGVERIHRFAFDLARSRPRKLLTMVTKSNAQRHGMVMWDEILRRQRRLSGREKR